MNLSHPPTSLHKQKGVALIIFAITILTIAGGAYIINSNRNTDTYSLKQKLTTQSLAQSKQALENFFIAYMPAASDNELGRLPFPDRGDDPARFDGESDCINFNDPLGNNLLLGRFPWLQEGGACPVININARFRDGSGEHLWYAVAPSMVRHTNNTGLGPNLQNAANFITIYDHLGNLLSDKVAFVVFSPGEPLPGQNRLNRAASNFLDSYNVPGMGIINNADTNLVFVKAPVSGSFNDRLVYMTVDELMPFLINRVMSEYYRLIVQFKTDNGYYPYPAIFPDHSNLDCDINNPNPGFIATANTGPNICPNVIDPAYTTPTINDFLPNYLKPWQQYFLYFPRNDCISSNTSGCDNFSGGQELQIDGTGAIDFVLFYTGIHSFNSTALTEYIEDAENRNADNVFVTPVINAIPANQDQLIYR